MKHLLKLLTRLYPSAWRNRYGAEFEALLEDKTPTLQDLFDVLRAALKMRMTSCGLIRIVLSSSVAGALITCAIFFAQPARFVSETPIAITPRGEAVPHPIREFGKHANAEALRYLSNTAPNILAQKSLAPIIQKLDLYPQERAHMPLDAVVEKMRKSIYVSPFRRGDVSGIVLKFSYPDPRVAQHVNAELTSLFISSLLSATAEHPQSASHAVFRVLEVPSLPLKPSGMNLFALIAVGLVTGFSGGLVLAATLRSNRKMASQ
jgi:hypothetical protein